MTLDIKPRLIKRQRTKGWRMPVGAIYVGRPGPWGNPWRVDAWIGLTALVAVSYFSEWLSSGYPRGFARRHQWILEHLPELRGKDLVCWCGDWTLGDPDPPACHGVVIMRLANAGMACLEQHGVVER